MSICLIEVRWSSVIYFFAAAVVYLYLFTFPWGVVVKLLKIEQAFDFSLFKCYPYYKYARGAPAMLLVCGC